MTLRSPLILVDKNNKPIGVFNKSSTERSCEKIEDGESYDPPEFFREFEDGGLDDNKAGKDHICTILGTCNNCKNIEILLEKCAINNMVRDKYTEHDIYFSWINGSSKCSHCGTFNNLKPKYNEKNKLTKAHTWVKDY